MRWKLKDNCRHQYRSAGPVSDLVYRYIENLPGNQKNQTHGTLKFERKNKQFQITGNEARGVKIILKFLKKQSLMNFNYLHVELKSIIQQMLITLSMKYYAVSPFQLG